MLPESSPGIVDQISFRGGRELRWARSHGRRWFFYVLSTDNSGRLWPDAVSTYAETEIRCSSKPNDGACEVLKADIRPGDCEASAKTRRPKSDQIDRIEPGRVGSFVANHVDSHAYCEANNHFQVGLNRA